MNRTLALSGAGAALALVIPLMALAPTGVASTPGVTAAFARTDVDTAVQGAAFTAVGEVFPGERNIVTTGYGALTQGTPAGGGTLGVYRPGASLDAWTRVDVFDSSAEVVFPNRPTIVDMNADGRNDILLPYGYFFDTNPDNPGGAKARSGIAWWENQGLDPSGKPRPFVRHDILTGQEASYHGVEWVDLDGDGTKDIVTTAEAGKYSDNQSDDTVRLQYLKGTSTSTSAPTFAAPVVLAEGSGGSHPTVADVDSDGRLDIVSSQYFNLTYMSHTSPSFMWFRQSGALTGGTLGAANFTRHTIATLEQAGFGFQIQAVPNFRAPGKTSWIGTNHQGRCFVDRLISKVFPQAVNVREIVMEFVPGADPTQPWKVVELSEPANPVAEPDKCDPAFNVSNSSVDVHPTDHITARSAGGQAAPGVFGFGDLDGDGDVDLAVSGDGDRRLFWVEQRPGHASGTVLRTLSRPGELFGQSGGAIVDDLDGDGRPEMVFSSFDTNTVAIWSRAGTVAAPDPTPRPTPPITTPPITTPPVTKPPVTKPPVAKPPAKVSSVRTSLKVSSPKSRPRVGRKATWTIRLSGASKGTKRSVKVTFKATGAKKSSLVKRVTVKPGKGKVHTAKLTWRPRKSGALTFRYAGGKVKKTAVEKPSSAKVKVRVRR